MCECVCVCVCMCMCMCVYVYVYVYVCVCDSIHVIGEFRDSANSPGSAGHILSSTVTGTNWITGGGGDVVGPASSVDNEIPLFNSTTGVLLKNSTGLFFDPTARRLSLINGAGDTSILFDRTGIRQWLVGIDDSDVDKFKITSGTTAAAFGTTDRIVINPVNGSLVVGTTITDSNAVPPAVDMVGSWIRIGDAGNPLTFPNGLGIKFHDGGVAHSSIKYDSTNKKFLFGDSSANGDSLNIPGVPAATMDLGNLRFGINNQTPLSALDVQGSVSVKEGFQTLVLYPLTR